LSFTAIVVTQLLNNSRQQKENVEEDNPLIELLENSQLTEVSGPGIDLKPKSQALKREITKAANDAGIRDVDIENTRFMSQEFEEILQETLEKENFYSPEGFDEILEEVYLPGTEIASQLQESLDRMPIFAGYEVTQIHSYMQTKDTVNSKLEIQPTGEPGSLAETVRNMTQIYRSRQDLIQGWQISGETSRETYEELVE